MFLLNKHILLSNYINITHYTAINTYKTNESDV